MNKESWKTHTFSPEIMEIARTLRASSFIGRGKTVAPIAPPSSPDRIYAHYKTLGGDQRLKYYDQHKDTLWTHYMASLKSA
jgi:hypothetical protein